jgi:Flp pilus assembly pilin Flp
MQTIMRSFREETTAYSLEYFVIACAVAAAVLMGLLQFSHAW